MGLTVFNQFPQLTRLLARIARVTCEAETEVVFDGTEFEGEGGGEQAAPSVGETVIYLFTETSPGVFLASRKAVEKIEEEE